MLQEKDKSMHVVGSVAAPQRYPHPRAPSQVIVTFHGQGDLAVWLNLEMARLSWIAWVNPLSSQASL